MGFARVLRGEIGRTGGKAREFGREHYETNHREFALLYGNRGNLRPHHSSQVGYSRSSRAGLGLRSSFVGDWHTSFAKEEGRLMTDAKPLLGCISDLGAAWSDLAGSVTASGSTAATVDGTATGAKRFYRVIVSD
jgi:hypothetical protein